MCGRPRTSTSPGSLYYGLLLNKRLDAKSAADLNGATICALQDCEIERNVQDYATWKLMISRLCQ
jgi:hypothetical protein